MDFGKGIATVAVCALAGGIVYQGNTGMGAAFAAVCIGILWLRG